MDELRQDVADTVESLERPSMTLVATARSTGGVLEMVADTRDAGDGAPPHIHYAHDEAFYVLRGRFTFVRGNDELETNEGETVFVPRGTRHGYRSHADGGSVLFVVLPAGLSAFLHEQGRLVKAGVPVRDAMERLSSRYDTTPVE